MDKIWLGHNVKGMFEPYQFDTLVEWFQLNFKPDDEFELIIRKPRKLSSLPQNRYYYGIIVKMISDYTGHTLAEVDTFLKWKFLKQTDEKGLEYVPSKMELTTVEKEQYHKSCRRWSLIALDLPIPLPHEIEIPELVIQEE